MNTEEKPLMGIMASRVYTLSRNTSMKCIITDEEEGAPPSIVVVIGQDEPIRS